LSRKIYGLITDKLRNDTPIGGLRIQVWDRDWPDGDDFLGQTYTSIEGQYEVSYFPGDWDKAIGLLDLGRPDIFITVENKNAAGKWVSIAESDVIKNHNMKHDLRIDLPIEFGGPLSGRTNFIPENDGFHFINSFKVKPDIFGIDFGEWNMGLCGGMCASALSRFSKGEASPDDLITPHGKTSLYDELKKRQIKTMSPKMLAKMAEFQGAPDNIKTKRNRSIGQRTQDEWPIIKSTIDGNTPLILVLIRSTGLLGNPTNNHQVLAVGYDFNPPTKDLRLYVYDPNKPDETQTISLNVGLPGGSLDLVDSASPLTRGLFVNPVGEEAAEV